MSWSRGSWSLLMRKWPICLSTRSEGLTVALPSSLHYLRSSEFEVLATGSTLNDKSPAKHTKGQWPWVRYFITDKFCNPLRPTIVS
eukprot:5882243-Amphidinium_carterae.1